MGLYDDEINAERDEELAQAKRTIDALVAALEVSRPLIVSEWDDEHRVVKQIDAALALARGEG